MSKIEHYKIFVNGAGYDATGYGITPHFFSIDQPNGEMMFFPWANVEHVRFVKKWGEIARKQAEEAQRRQNPAIEIPRGPVVPFDPNAKPN